MKALLIFTITLFFVSDLYAHSRLLLNGSTPPRSTSPGIKTGPCGTTPKANVVASFNSGQTITIQWEETIDHPGYFEFFLSEANDQNFVLLTTVQDTQNGTAFPHRYQVQVDLPDGVTCNNCTLQMIQQMTENPNNPRPYFSCSDIRIAVLGEDTPTPPIDEVPVEQTPNNETNHNCNSN